MERQPPVKVFTYYQEEEEVFGEGWGGFGKVRGVGVILSNSD